ncbi:hypothetical protein Trydic_g20314 [Trypoxylus dichotomus]
MLKLSYLLLVVFVTNCLAEVRICDRPNEVYACGSACQTTCRNLGKPCPYINVRCNDRCYCKRGYARDDLGVCIPIINCPGIKDEWKTH